MASTNWTFNRDTSNDTVTVSTLYTLTSNIEVGTALYDAEGNNTGLTIASVNQDGTFNLPEATAYYAWYSIKATSLLTDGIYYTLSETPSVGDALYEKVTSSSGYIIEQSTATVHLFNSTNNTITDTNLAYTFTRDSSKDTSQAS